jgi:hypothetical protein
LIVAILGLEVFGVILGGYSSASKWSLFGAMREAAQVVSYEVPLGLCAVVPVMLAGSMDLVTLGDVKRPTAAGVVVDQGFDPGGIEVFIEEQRRWLPRRSSPSPRRTSIWRPPAGCCLTAARPAPTTQALASRRPS